MSAAWFSESRFGLFLHWGISAGLRGDLSWTQLHRRLSAEEYRCYFDSFEPDLYDPVAWAREARSAGMRYVVVTTKHHDGFCLWDSPLTDFKAPNTPAGRDLLRPLVDAFRAEGIRVGFYYSLIDWNHPEYPVDALHPLRHDAAFRERERGRDMSKYADYLHAQVRELLTEFGRIDLLWLDFSYPDLQMLRDAGIEVPDWATEGKGRADWRSEELVRMVRELQPGILINNRADVPGDFLTPEQYAPVKQPTIDGKPAVWEACQTLNSSWAYAPTDRKWKSTEQLIRLLIDTVSKGGNLLLNVGPDVRGCFEARALERLHGIGEWTRLHSRAIYGCGPSEFVPPPDCRYTQNGDRLFLSVFAWPASTVFYLEGLAGRVEFVRFLHDGVEVEPLVVDFAKYLNLGDATPPPSSLALPLPAQKPDVAVPVIELFLKSSNGKAQ